MGPSMSLLAIEEKKDYSRESDILSDLKCVRSVKVTLPTHDERR